VSLEKRAGKSIVYTAHAETVMGERCVERSWVERVIASPQMVDLDPFSPHRTRAFGRINEFGDRWLRVVYEQSEEKITVVTAFFDRNAGRRE
jgi:Domain of unknown function (DUF4258)